MEDTNMTRYRQSTLPSCQHWVGLTSPCAKICHAHPVEMHNVFKISLVVRREALSITLLVEGCTDLENIVHFYRLDTPRHGRGRWLVEVTEFSTRGGSQKQAAR
ncbi:hypothetical protein M438DRAFT_165473 [Aureobasidium pullulans EXF-150]|uniref:Uncharacterized protein n=1 Tax=Aureobasidium pullulans EXF-150 TaxID=1043002 RepID=A0A074XZ36_AURPU|nr:uncharacterized protein M438DRAFT_165473 [Aureobasidium pullulans EXF-150]KEQ87237.1 hypothetical protein M438DRAFT_165473 [Aureobasidium pullulans EXF-150]